MPAVSAGLAVKCQSLLGGWEDARQAVSAALARVLDKFPTHITSGITPILYRKVLSALGPELAEGKRHLSHRADREVVEEDISVDEEEEDRLFWRLMPPLESILDKAGPLLDDIDREVLRLNAQGKNSSEISDQLGLTPGAVRLRLLYAIRTLQEGAKPKRHK